MKKTFASLATLGLIAVLVTSCGSTKPVSSNPFSQIDSSSENSRPSIPSDPSSLPSSSSESSSKSSETPKYTITWKNFDGAVLETDEDVLLGSTPTYDGLDPIRETTAQYTYLWTGWTPEVVPVSGNTEYTATFRQETNQYTVTWKNEDDQVLKTEQVFYGTTPEYTGETPTKEETVEHTYTFDKWSPEITPVDGDIVYTASYKEELRKYNIIWKNSDGSVLKTDEVPYGTVPAYDDEDPQQESTAQYAYAFAGWSPNVQSVTGDAEYTATYSADLRKYTITWTNQDGQVLEVDNDVLYGSAPEYNGEKPTKDSIRGVNYTFSGWSPDVELVTGDKTYVAEFNEEGFFSFEPINYEMENGFTLASINGAPWINANVKGELKKIKQPSLKDDYYTSINYDSIKRSQPGAFDACDSAVRDAFNAIYSGAAADITTNGDALKVAYDALANSNASKVSNYLSNLDINAYLSSKETFASKSGILALTPTDDGYEVDFNDGYFTMRYSSLPMSWTFDNMTTVAKNVLNLLVPAFNLGLSTSDIDNVRSREYSFVDQDYQRYYQYGFKTNSYTVGNIPWEPMQSALYDLGLESSTKIEIKKIYTTTLNSVYNTMLTREQVLLKNMIVTRLAFDYRFFAGINTYRSVNQYLTQLADYFSDEAYLYYGDDGSLLRGMLKSCFPILVEQAYIELQSTEEMKAEVAELIQDVLDEYMNLADTSWLGDTTKEKMKKKLSKMEYVACYSDAYKDFVRIGDDDIYSKTAFDVYRLYTNGEVTMAARKNIDTTGYFDYMHSYVVNAFYSPGTNSFVILNALTRVMLGNCVEEKLGMLATVIGHEITHAFDSSGANYDENGNYNNWWTSADKKEFNRRVDKLIAFYNQIALKKNFYVDGDTIDGEATADMGGIKVALMIAKKYDNFDYDKFFRAFAYLWCTYASDISGVESRASDAHPFNYLRVNVTLAQFDEFVETYDIKPGDGMYIPEEQRINVW